MAKYAIRDQGLAMQGFTSLNRALGRISGPGNYGLEYELKRRLLLIGEAIARGAPKYVSHKTGRHGDPSEPKLEDSVKVGVTTRYASVYSTAIHGGVQNVGGRVGRGHATLLRRSEVSGWMIKAVSSASPYVAEQMQSLLDWLEMEFNAR